MRRKTRSRSWKKRRSVKKISRRGKYKKKSKSNPRSLSKGRNKTTSLEKRLFALNPDRKPLSYKSPRLKRGQDKKKKSVDYKFPSIPKNSPRYSTPKVKNTCGVKLQEMRKKYRKGQKLIDEVDRFMGKQ